MKYSSIFVGTGASLMLIVAPTTSYANDITTFEELFIKGSLIADFRLRYEAVEQEGLANDAEALTLRGRLGFETAEAYGFSALAELETVQHLGGADFNDTLNGKTTFPVVADPESTQLNRLQLRYSNDDWLDITFGRQRIKLDDDRFIGNVGFRQNEQTFDAARVDVTPLENLTVRYIYLNQVNRIFGEDSPVGRFDLNGHAVNVSYDLGPVEAVGYAYLIENEDVSALSSQSYGLRLRATQELQPVKVNYGGEIAQQSDYENNSSNFEHLYYALDAAASWAGFSLGGAYRVLEGDGVTAFQTPYATGHKFHGFADLFLSTPSGGIEDLSATAKYTMKDLGWAEKVGAFATYHDFSAESSGLSYGSEVDLGAFAKFGYGLGTEVKYADYSADGFGSDQNKLWLTATYSY